MKMCFTVDGDTVVSFHDEEIEPEIVIRTSEGLLVEIFGTKEDLKKFATELYEKTNQI